MRFQSIEIKNYRQYRDLNLEFFQGEHDLQVIIADNGVGKTNLLNAFTWCLYGIEPHLGTSQKQGSRPYKEEPKLNKEVILECAQEGVASAIVSVTVDIDRGRGGKESTIRVRRTVPFSIAADGRVTEKKPQETLKVVIMRAGGNQVYSGESAQEYLNKLLPESIREYFFFDGEQLNNYFRETGGEKIKEAVYSISQIDLFTTMAERLGKVVREFTRQAASYSTNAKQYEKAKEQCERTLAGAQKFIAKSNQEIQELNNHIAEINDSLSGVENVGELEETQKGLQKKADGLAKALDARRGEYYDFVRQYIVDFYLYPIALKCLDHIREMQRGGQLPPQIDRGLLMDSLEAGECVICKHILSDEDRTRIDEMLESFKVGSETSNILSSMTSELQRVVDAVDGYPSKRDQYLGRLGDAEGALDAIEEDLKEVSAKVAKYAGRSEQLKELIDRRKKYQNELQKLSQEIGVKQNVARRMEIEINTADRKMRAELEKNAKARKLKELVDFGNRALGILRRAEKAVVDETRERMAEKTESLFKGLVWKGSKCQRIELTENYTPLLFDKYEYSCAGTCSAAERSLLALSFTLAMHEVSGFESPLFIDTPIARASGENRENFADTLVEVSEDKQLILAFTPDEYSASIEERFDPAISTLIRLRLDEDERHVMEPEVDRRG